MMPMRVESPRRRSPVTSKRFLVTVVAAVSFLLLPTVPALSSCIRDDRPLSLKIAEAEIVFVGTVLAVGDAGRTARFQVEEIWRGTELGEQVVVHGGPDSQSFSSVDRHWEPGARYLLFPRGDDGRLRDDECSPTIPWEPQLASFRPPDASPSETESGRTPTRAQSTEWVFVGSALLVLVLGIGWLFARHARTPPPDG